MSVLFISFSQVGEATMSPSRLKWGSNSGRSEIMSRSLQSIVYRLPSTSWAPWVIEEGGELKIHIGIDFNRGYDIREFLFPIADEHLEVIRADLRRHLLLWCVLEQLCERAGAQDRSGKPNKKKARAAIDLVLRGSEREIEEYFTREQVPTRRLIAHGANAKKLEKGELFAALKGEVTATSNWDLVWEYEINRDRARRGVHLSAFDVTLLKYLNKYLHMGALSSRRPDAVDPAVLPRVLEVIAVAERACARIELPADKPYPDPAWSKGWDDIDRAVRHGLQEVYPDLSEDTVNAISFLMGSEAADRARAAAKID